MSFSESFNSHCVFQAERERLLHHDVNTTRSGRFDNSGVLGNGAERGNRARPRGIEHPVKIGMEKTPIESELASVPVGYLAIGFVDSCKFNVPLLSALKNPGDVAMGKSRNRDRYALCRRCGL